MINKLISLFALAIICVACGKKEEPALGHGAGCTSSTFFHVTDPEFLAYSYQPGSYWVLKDSLSGNTDTLAVTQVSHSRAIKNGCDSLELIKVGLTFKHETTNPFTSFDLLIHPSALFFIDDYTNAFITLYTANVKKLDSLRINGTYYKNVVTPATISFASQSMKVVFTGNEGFLQFDFYALSTGSTLTSRRQLIVSKIVR